MRKALITGITGQDGAYLAKLLLEKNYRVIGVLREEGSDKSRLRYLDILSKIHFEICDLANFEDVLRLIKETEPDEIYNLAAASSVGASFNKPYEYLSYNINSVLNLLEAIRQLNTKCKLYQASSSEMFGKLETLPITGDENYHPLSPYAVSKVSGHLITKNYREAFGLFACTGILFNHESVLRSNQFFIKKIVLESIAIASGQQDSLKVGNLNVRRDFGSASKYVEAMYLMMQKEKPNDYIICSGKSILLKDIVEYVFKRFQIPLGKIIIDSNLIRPLELENIYGDNSKAKVELNWDYDEDFFKVLDDIIEEELRIYNLNGGRNE